MSIENDVRSTTTSTSYGTTSTSSTGTAGQTSGGSTTSETMSAASGEMRHLADEAKDKASSVFGRTRDQVNVQLREKSQEAGAAMRKLATELGHLAAGRPEQAGRAREYAEMAEQRLTQWANRLDYGGPDAVMADMRRFARRRPGMFLAAAAGAGFGIARLTRSGAASGSTQQQRSTSANGFPPPTGGDLSSAAVGFESVYDTGTTGVAV